MIDSRPTEDSKQSPPLPPTIGYGISPRKAWQQRTDRVLPIISWLVPLLVYLAVIIPTAWRGRYQINPDGIIYIRKAQFLLAGHVLQSISGYWSPGISWCVAAILKLSPISNPLNVIHATLAGWGFCWMVAGSAFLYSVAPAFRWGRLIGGIALAAVAVRLAVVWIAPDLLLCTFLLAYLTCWTWPKQRWWTPLLAGVFAGLGYLCKSYALPFVALHLPATLIFRQWTERPRPDWRRPLLLGFAGLAIAVIPWAAVLSYKYQKFTISMVYHHNHLNVATADYLRSSPDFCVVPPDPYLCIWEGLDPGPRVDWSPWSSARLFRHQIGIAISHIRYIIIEVFYFDRIAMILLLTMIALFPAHWAWSRPRSELSLWLLMTAAIYCLGFLAVAFETRYIVPILFPLGLALCLTESRRFNLPWGGIASAGIMCVVAIIAVWPFAVLNPPRPIFQKAARVMKQHHLKALFSSSNNNNGVNVSWYLDQKIVLLPAQEDIATVERKLRAAGVENMLIWTDVRTNVRDPFPLKLVSLMRRTHHWKLIVNLRLDSARTVGIYHWIGP